MAETYYKTLNITSTASENEIKKAYRKIAVRHHPDKNPGNKESEEIFRKATEAYEVLKDERKREIYDQTKSTTPSRYERFRKGSDLIVNLKVGIKDLIEGKKRLIITKRKGMCPTCSGTGSKNKKLTKCIYCNGTGVQGLALAMGNIKKCLYCQGAGSKPEGEKCTVCNGTALVTENIKHEVALNPISRTFVIKNKGNCCFKGKPGDLYIELSVKEDPNYKVRKLDIIGRIKISPVQAILGDTIKLTVFDKEVDVKIFPGTQNNANIKVKNAGVSYKGCTGYLRLNVQIAIPTVISDEEKVLYEKILNIEREMPCQKILSA